MDTPGSTIFARSKRQAMDWSLVLASQDIPTTILGPDTTNQWGLLVSPEDYERALSAIRQFRHENQGWSWRRDVPWPKTGFHSGSVVWCIFLAAALAFASLKRPVLFAEGRMDSLAVFRGEWWRLFTAVTLHADLAHLMGNLTFGVLFLGLAMARYGPGNALLAGLLSGAAGNLAGLFFYSHPYFGVGASGMMMGAVGLLGVHAVSVWRVYPKAAKYMLSGIITAALVFILFGTNPSSDVIAHFGGFVAGTLLGIPLALEPENRILSKGANLFSVLIVVAILGIGWFQAAVR